MTDRRNVEIKARVADLPALRQRVASLSDSTGQTLEQEDTFFQCASGRLKLREEGPEKTELIYYQRPDQHGPKRCDFMIYPTQRDDRLKTVLTEALGVVGVVRKTRCLFRIGQARIHLDQVEGLGDFLELEVVLEPEQSDAAGDTIARQLMQDLGINEDQLLAVAYIDLLT